MFKFLRRLFGRKSALTAPIAAQDREPTFPLIDGGDAIAQIPAEPPPVDASSSVLNIEIASRPVPPHGETRSAPPVEVQPPEPIHRGRRVPPPLSEEQKQSIREQTRRVAAAITRMHSPLA